MSLFTFSGYGQSNLNGTWITGEDNTVIEIAESAGKILGKIKSTDNPKATIGKVIVKDLKKNEKERSMPLKDKNGMTQCLRQKETL